MYVVFFAAIFGFLITAIIVNGSLRSVPVRQLEYRIKSSRQVESQIEQDAEEPTQTTPNQELKEHRRYIFHSAERNLIYNYYPPLLVWSMMVNVLLTFAFAAFPLGLLYLLALRKSLRIDTRQLRLALLATILVIVLSISMNLMASGLLSGQEVVGTFEVLFKNTHVLNYVAIATILLLSPFVLLVFIVSSGASAMKMETTEESIAESMENFAAIQSAIKLSLTIITISIVLTVITTGLLGESIRAAISIKEFEVFPLQFGYMYGLYFSLFLFIIFTPTYFYIRYKKLEFISNLKNTHGAEQAYDFAKESLTNTDQKLADQVRILLVMLSPFISSFLPEWISHLF